MPKLDVPIILPLQEDGNSCVPRCVKMVFMYISNSSEGRIPDFDLDKIGKIVEIKRDGTYPEKVLNLNKVKEVVTAMPSIEFEYEMKTHAIDEIEEELNDKQPMIAWVTLMKGKRSAHAVVITGLDMETRTVYYNDPIYGQQEEDLPSFLTRWEDQDHTLLKVKIGKKTQRILEEFPKEETKDSATQLIGERKDGSKP
jgi:hypothetical protein